MNRPIYCGCGYKLIYSGEIRLDMLTPMPRCPNPVHPNNPSCPECDELGPHQLTSGSGHAHMLCRRGHSFDPKESSVP